MLTTEMVKTFQFLGAILLFGGAGFALLIWLPALRSTERADRESSPLSYLPLIAGLGAGAMLLFGALDLIRFARVAADQPLGAAGWEFLRQVATDTRYGRMILLRSGIALGALALVWYPRWRLAGPYWPIRELLFALLGGAALISFSLASHAVATQGQGPWPLLADMGHVLASGAWLGGLVLLALAPWRLLMAEANGRLLLRRVTARFATLGLVAVTTLALTGIYMASLRLYSPRALTETDYGIALLVKVLLFGALLTVALANRVSLLPGLQADEARARRSGAWLHRLIGAEVLLAFVALSFAADLTILSPADEDPVRVTVTITADGVEPSALTLPLGRPVRITLDNRQSEEATISLRDFEHRLNRGPGAVRHREMLSFVPPTDRFALRAAPGKRVVAEFTPLAEGQFLLETGGATVSIVVSGEDL